MCSSADPPRCEAARSFSELADAPVDAGWLAEVAGLLHSIPVEGAAAVAALRVFARAESVLAAARIRATEMVAFLADTRTPPLPPDFTEPVDPAKLPPSTADLEVAAALRVTTGSAHYQIAQARQIHSMPGFDRQPARRRPDNIRARS